MKIFANTKTTLGKIKTSDKAIVLLCLAIAFFSYMMICVLFRFCDTVCFTVWGVEFWDVIFSAEKVNYYDLYQVNIRNIVGDPQGSWLTFFPFIIWDFPLWLTHPYSDNWDVSGMSCILWNKALLMLFLIILCVYIYKIIVAYNADRKKEAFICAFLTAGSLEMIQSVAYAGQDEIVYLALFTAAIYYRMKSKGVPYLLLMTISITICPLMLIPFIFVELLYTLNTRFNFLKLFVHTVLVLLPTFVFELVYRNNVEYHLLSKNNTVGLFRALLSTGTIDTTFGSASICAIMLVILGVFCLKNSRSGKELEHQMIWMVSASLFALFCFPSVTWYRLCVIIPFLAILIGISDGFSLNCILLIMVDISRFFCSFEADNSIYNFSNYFSSSISSKLFGKELTGRIIDSQMGWYNYLSLPLRCIAFGGVAAVLLFTFTKKEEKGIFVVKGKYILLIQSFIILAWLAYVVTINLMQ